MSIVYEIYSVMVSQISWRLRLFVIVYVLVVLLAACLFSRAEVAFDARRTRRRYGLRDRGVYQNYYNGDRYRHHCDNKIRSAVDSSGNAVVYCPKCGPIRLSPELPASLTRLLHERSPWTVGHD